MFFCAVPVVALWALGASGRAVSGLMVGRWALRRPLDLWLLDGRADFGPAKREGGNPRRASSPEQVDDHPQRGSKYRNRSWSYHLLVSPFLLVFVSVVFGAHYLLTLMFSFLRLWLLPSLLTSVLANEGRACICAICSFFLKARCGYLQAIGLYGAYAATQLALGASSSEVILRAGLIDASVGSKGPAHVDEGWHSTAPNGREDWKGGGSS
jgi:hypothetical protein